VLSSRMDAQFMNRLLTCSMRLHLSLVGFLDTLQLILQ